MKGRFAPGLRARIVASLALTSAVTLAVAALALLPPLDSQLRRDERDSLETTASAQVPAFGRLSRRASRARSPRLESLVRTVAARTEAQVGVVGPSGLLLATDRLPRSAAATPAASRALRTRRTVFATVETEQGSEAQIALPLSIGDRRGVLVVRRSLTEAAEAAAVVRQSFLLAGLAGLGVAVALGAVLATRLVRRLRALRDTALRVADIGPAAEVEVDEVRDEVGDLTRALATSQERLRAQEDARRRFVATASHELRTPLASMLLTLESLEADLSEGVVDLNDAQAQVARARDQTQRLTMLSADLLDLSRIDASVPLRRERLDLTRLAANVAAELAPRAERQDSRVVIQGDGECWADVDPGSAVRIVRILVDNALKFAPSQSDVTISLASRPGRASVEVSDRGAGVPEEEEEMIFERFHRGTGAGEQMGFGLGLAIGRELARRMGGDLRLDRQAPGTTFTLMLPAEGPITA